jgi:hypothetical protein
LEVPKWKKSLSNLDDWTTSVQTDPDIQQAILTSLNDWRFSEDTEFSIPFSLKMVIEQQQDIGRSPFLEGWTSFEWEHAQQAYYEFLNIYRTGRRWATELIKKLWQVAWDLWEHRNGIFHHQTNSVSNAILQSIDRRVRTMYTMYQTILSSAMDKYLFTVPLQTLLTKDLIYKKEWIATLKAVVREKRMNRWITPAILTQMRRTLRRWLRTRGEEFAQR